MNFSRMVYADAEALGLYLGFSLEELLGGWVVHRECPNCVTYDHSQHTVLDLEKRLIVDGVSYFPDRPMTREDCLRRLLCNGCTHGKECHEYRKGIYRTLLKGRDGSVRRFLTEKEFAGRIGRHYTTVRRWITVGKINEANGLVRGAMHNFIDTQKCPLLRKRSRVRAKLAA